jgi:hypothetical protein
MWNGPYKSHVLELLGSRVALFWKVVELLGSGGLLEEWVTGDYSWGLNLFICLFICYCIVLVTVLLLWRDTMTKAAFIRESNLSGDFLTDLEAWFMIIMVGSKLV